MIFGSDRDQGTDKESGKKLAAGVAEPLRDDGESIALMEPMTVSESSRARAKIAEQAFELSQKAAAFRASLPAGLIAPLADLVRSMNCYYSNLIEGHNTHPVDIERAIHNELSEDPRKRDLQLEAKAHIAVQRWIDDGHLDGRELTQAGVFEIHRQFASLLPDELLWVDGSAPRTPPAPHRAGAVGHLGLGHPTLAGLTEAFRYLHPALFALLLVGR